MLEKHLSNTFLLYLVVEILQLVHEITSFLEVLYKRNDLKTCQNSQINKKQSSGGDLSKDALKNFAKFTEVFFLIKLQAGNLKLSQAATGNVLQKKVFLKRCTGVSEPAVNRSSKK